MASNRTRASFRPSLEGLGDRRLLAAHLTGALIVDAPEAVHVGPLGDVQDPAPLHVTAGPLSLIPTDDTNQSGQVLFAMLICHAWAQANGGWGDFLWAKGERVEAEAAGLRLVTRTTEAPRKQPQCELTRARDAAFASLAR
jgi:hypothetical protein